jgi:hypothetical protein
MAKKKKKKGLEKEAVVVRAREFARDGETYWADNWAAAEEDLWFLDGSGQWPDEIRKEREAEGRPCLTNNVLPTFVDQVIGDQRQNKPNIKISKSRFTKVQDKSGQHNDLEIPSVDGKNLYSLPDVMSGIVKSIENKCDAETSYDLAFESAVESGMGYLRVRSDWCNDDFEQELIIDHIENQFSVILDPSAQKRDYSDMNRCIINSTMLKEVFEKKYPDATIEPLDSTTPDSLTWFQDKTVRISEYFEREEVFREKALLSDGRSMYMEDLEDILDELEEKGITVVRTRKVKSHKVIWYKVSGNDVLEGPEELPFESIPVVPVWGKSITIKDKKIFRGMVRYSKDAQRMANYWDSAATEAVALAPKAPFVGVEEHFEGHPEWDTANTENHSKLTYNAQFPGDNGPRREQPAAIPAAEITLGQNSVDKIKSTLGLFDASVGAAGPEISGRAIIARQRQGDRGSFAYIDNLSKAVRRVGKLLVEATPKVMDTERITRIMFEDGSEDYVKINEKIFDDDSGEWKTIYDLGVAEYEVTVTTGPAFATQRIEAAEAMIQFAQAVPASAAVMADLIARNMDWPGADVISERLRKIVPPEVLTQKEREEIQKDAPEQQEPTPEQQLMAQELDVKKMEAEADAQQAQADIVKAQAEVEKAKADTAQAQLKTAEAQSKLQHIEAGANSGSVDYQQIREIVAQAVAELVSGQEVGTV